MRDFLRAARQFVRVPMIRKAEDVYASLSAGGRILFLSLAGVLVASAVALLFILNAQLLVKVPAHGGTLSEGIIGTPRFINPILALSDSDRDISHLVYSGLLRTTENGQYIPDLAESYSVSPDGKTYTATLRKNVTFQDGSPVTADDIVFTIQKIQDPAIKSPMRANWSGVTVQKIDDRTVQFTLNQAYAPFIENLTLGIVPKHLWQNVSNDEMSFSELNTSPVGSGPFRINSISHTSAGIPSSYDLVSFDNYALGAPYLDHITLHFYQNEDDLLNGLKGGSIEAASGVSPAALTGLKGFTIDKSSLNRVFGVFFNQNQSETLRDSAVRNALQTAIDRDTLIQQALGGYGTALSGPIPPGLINTQESQTQSATATSSTDRIAAARAILTKAGWKLGQDGFFAKTVKTGKKTATTTLSFSLATGNVPELRAAAEYLRSTWAQVGVQVTVQVYDQGDLSQNVIRPRKYDALLFGEVIGRELDLFAFWHSSQRTDPGLNIAMYANTTVDTILTKLRQTQDDNQREQLYGKFEAELQKDVPAIFLYAPDFVYIVPNDLQGLDLNFIETPSVRFANVYQWHRETDEVWPVFVR